MIVFDAAALSRTGPRADNQDSALAGPRLLAVADGVGGNVGGAIASSLVAGWLAPFGCGSCEREGPEALAHVIQRANTRIPTAYGVRPNLRGMATTLVAISAGTHGVVLASIGDSRAYLLRNDVLSQVTVDQTLVQALVDAGRLAPEDITTHPQRSVVYAAMHGGVEDTDALVVRWLDVRPGDRLLVCSDGLSDFVAAARIAAVLAAGSPQEAAAGLVRLALDAPTHDNVTVVVGDAVESLMAGSAAVRSAGAAAHLREETAEALEALWP